MAARVNKPLHDEQTKRRIQASQLLNRLELFANGKVEMTTAQVMAAKIVIGKSIPDLKSIEYSGNDEKPVQRRMVVEFVEPKRSKVEAKFLFSQQQRRILPYTRVAAAPYPPLLRTPSHSRVMDGHHTSSSLPGRSRCRAG